MGGKAALAGTNSRQDEIGIGGIYASEKVILMLRNNPVDLWKHSLKHKDNCNDDTDAQYGTKRSDNWEGVNV